MHKRESNMNIREKVNLSIDEARELFGLGRQSLMRVASECGAVIKVGKRTLLSRSDLEDYFQNQKRRVTNDFEKFANDGYHNPAR